MNTIDYQKQNEAFVDLLTRECRDRGHRASLRRWWSQSTRHHAYPILGKLRILDDSRKTLLAALFATHSKDNAPAHKPGGHSIGSAALKLGGGNTKSDAFSSMERHFRRLLAAEDLDALAPQLQRLVKRLEREGIPLDYARLLSDLRLFRNNAEKVKTGWALDFWQAPASPDTPSKS